jgi:hypothetical protein
MIARLLGSIGPSPARNKLTYDWKAAVTCFPQRKRAERSLGQT